MLALMAQIPLLQAQSTLPGIPDPILQDTSIYYCMAPTQTAPDNLIYPEFIGGVQQMLTYLYSRINYPMDARWKGIEGAVVVSFVVEKDGSLSNIAIVRDIGGGCSEEVVRIVQSMPNWKPGTLDGQPVRAQFYLPVRFKLEGGPKDKRGKRRKRL